MTKEESAGQEGEMSNPTAAATTESAKEKVADDASIKTAAAAAT
jgi:hypothetical protein